MTLQVPFEGFAHAAQELAGVKSVFVLGHPTGSIATCADPVKGVHVVCVSHLDVDEAREQLTQAGLKVCEGVWSEEGNVRVEADPLSSAYVAAVAYVSSEHVPGIWVDSYPDQPNHVTVLRAMYDEFRQTGELDDVSFEEFIRLANPNVVVVSATEMRGYLAAKEA